MRGRPDVPHEVLDTLTFEVRRALHTRVRDARRVDAYYAPIAAWCAARLDREAHRPRIVGVQGPQGSGKTTLASSIAAAFGDAGVRAVAVSIDDFYLTHEEQRALAARHPGNPYLRYRGYPGTHDVALGLQTLDALAGLKAGAELRVPRYAKGAHDGRGDRAPECDWPRVVGPVDLIFVEGWLLGFSPVDEGSLEPDLRGPNAMLAAYGAYSRRLDAFVRLDVPSLHTIMEWRVDAERARRAAGEPALDDEDARDYIARFLPAYRVYLPPLRANPPCRDVKAVALGEDRMPVGRIED
jgi:D-glycerate 3-kinase